MTTRPKRTITKRKLKKLSEALGGRSAIAEAIGMSRPAVDRYFVGKGMRQETFDKLTRLIEETTMAPAATATSPELLPEPPTLEEQGGHLFALLARALERNSGVEALEAQLIRIEQRLMRIEENQGKTMHAWQMTPAPILGGR